MSNCYIESSVQLKTTASKKVLFKVLEAHDHRNVFGQLPEPAINQGIRRRHLVAPYKKLWNILQLLFCQNQCNFNSINLRSSKAVHVPRSTAVWNATEQLLGLINQSGTMYGTNYHLNSLHNQDIAAKYLKDKDLNFIFTKFNIHRTHLIMSLRTKAIIAVCTTACHSFLMALRVVMKPLSWSL